jgi:hypothetical protein
MCFIGHYENISWRSRHAFSLSPFHTILVYCTIARMSSFSGQCERLSRRLVLLLSVLSCFSCFFRRREIDSVSQDQFLVFKSIQFTIQISFQDGGHSVSEYFSIKQFLHLSTDFTAFFCRFWIHPTLHFLGSWLGVFSRATSLEMRYLDRWVFRILYVT